VTDLEQKSVPVDLIADGALWAINRTLFHPRGFALALMSDGGLGLCGNGTTPYVFQLSDEDNENMKFENFEALLARARAQ
jgi:hypothetical protein